MGHDSNADGLPALALDDEHLLEEIFSILGKGVHADPYSDDGSYATAIRQLPVGLRAMAATHHLDISLTLDDIGWHFLNFGEAGLVAETESGLRVLGLNDLAEWFAEALRIMRPRLSEIKEPGDYIERLTRHGCMQRINELTDKAHEKGTECGEQESGGPIYEAWVMYARRHPGEVFGH
jgi:hypothetical protein